MTASITAAAAMQRLSRRPDDGLDPKSELIVEIQWLALR